MLYNYRVGCPNHNTHMLNELSNSPLTSSPRCLAYGVHLRQSTKYGPGVTCVDGTLYAEKHSAHRTEQLNIGMQHYGGKVLSQQIPCAMWQKKFFFGQPTYKLTFGLFLDRVYVAIAARHCSRLNSTPTTYLVETHY